MRVLRGNGKINAILSGQSKARGLKAFDTGASEAKGRAIGLGRKLCVRRTDANP